MLVVVLSMGVIGKNSLVSNRLPDMFHCVMWKIIFVYLWCVFMLCTCYHISVKIKLLDVQVKLLSPTICLLPNVCVRLSLKGTSTKN